MTVDSRRPRRSSCVASPALPPAVLVLAAGHASVSAAHPAGDRSCGLITDADGARIGIVVKRGSVPCSTARKVLRTYFKSHAPYEGSSCVRKRSGLDLPDGARDRALTPSQLLARGEVDRRLLHRRL